MQASGQYVPEIPPYVVGRAPPSHNHMFNLSHGISLSSSSGHAHPHGLFSHPLYHHQQQRQQQQQHLQRPQHHSQTQQSQQHATSQKSQQQQCQQTPPLSQLQQPPEQEQQPPPPPSYLVQQQSHSQHNQQPMVQQPGLNSDSPETPSPVACRPSPGNNFTQALVVTDQSLSVTEEHDGPVEEGDRGTGGNRWPRPETLALLKIRADMDSNFRDSTSKGALWEEVSRKLAEMGYRRSAKKCKEKFENVHKYYKRTKDGKAGRQDGKSYRYFTQLEALYGNGNEPLNVNNMSACNLEIDDGGTIIGNRYNTNVHGKGEFLTLTGCTSTGAGECNGSAQRPDLDYSSGLNFTTDSSEDDYEDQSDNPDSKKRKRKFSKCTMFFENLVKKILDKQEKMQEKFLEAVERRENERVIREEAWKRQEIARMTREQELRAQERTLAATRDAALVAFLQKVTGQTLQLPQTAIPAPPVSSVPTHEDDHFQERAQIIDPNSKRWPKPEIQALIKLRSGMNSRFHEAGPKGPLWEEISYKMGLLGYSRSAKRCKEKWENINKYFKKTKESNKRRPENAKTCPYFHQLDALYSNGLLGANRQLTHKADNQPEELREQPNGSMREDSGRVQKDCQILAIMPAGENETVANTNRNGNPTQFFSTPENGNSGDQDMDKGTSSQ